MPYPSSAARPGLAGVKARSLCFRRRPESQKESDGREKKVAHTDPEKIWGTCFRGRFPYENLYFVPAWRPRSVSEMYSERVASILLCFALLCTALFCVAPLCFALLRLVWETGTNDGMNEGINENLRDSSSPAGGAGGAPGGDLGGFQK